VREVEAILANEMDIHEFSGNGDWAKKELRALGGRLEGLGRKDLETIDGRTLAWLKNWLADDRQERIEAIMNEAWPAVPAEHYSPNQEIELDGPDRDGPDFG
jgi:hypothetical protein